MTATRIPCSAPGCRRTCKAEHDWNEWLCARHWRLVPHVMRRAYHRAWRRKKQVSVLNRLWFRCKAAAIRETLMGFQA